jgi:hypothetical protein
MMGNYHVRFLGGKGVVTPLTYPVPTKHKDFSWVIMDYSPSDLVILLKAIALMTLFSKSLAYRNMKCHPKSIVSYY